MGNCLSIADKQGTEKELVEEETKELIEEEDIPSDVLDSIMKETEADIAKPVNQETVEKTELKPSTEIASMDNIVKALSMGRMDTLRDIATHHGVKGGRSKASIIEVIVELFATELTINTSITKPLLSRLLVDLEIPFRKADRKEMWIRALHTFILNKSAGQRVETLALEIRTEQVRAEVDATLMTVRKTEAEAKVRAEAKARAEALEAKTRAEAKVKAEIEAKVRAEVKSEAEAKARAEAEAKAMQEQKVRELEAKAKAEARARAEAVAKVRADADAKARAEIVAKYKAAVEAKTEARAKARLRAKASDEDIRATLFGVTLKTLIQIAEYLRIEYNKSKGFIIGEIAHMFVTESSISANISKELIQKMLIDLKVSFNETQDIEALGHILHVFILRCSIDRKATEANIIKVLSRVSMETLTPILIRRGLDGRADRTRANAIELISDIFSYELYIDRGLTKDLVRSVLVDLELPFRESDNKDVLVTALHAFLLNPDAEHK